ncbi:MAG: endolytic transglycosylase MltG, partial [Phenylobacterium sp.]
MRKGQSPLRLLGGAIVALFLLATLTGGWVIWTYRGPGPAAREGAATTVILERGSSVAQIARDLARAGVIRSAAVFALAARLNGAAVSLKAGEYEIKGGTPMARLLGDIEAGKVV